METTETGEEMRAHIIYAGQNIPGIPQNPVASNDESLHFLLLVARVLLEFSARTEGIKYQIDRVAKHLGVEVMMQVAYRDVTLIASDGKYFHAQINEHRLNASLVTEMLNVINLVCSDSIGIDEATRRIESATQAAPRVGAGMLSVIYGITAVDFALLMRADTGAIIVSGLSTALGFFIRRVLVRRHVLLFVPPFISALIGAVLGGIVFRLGWTHTPGACLMIPALILIPGPHLINSLTEVLENHIQMGVARLGLSAAIIIATLLGVLLGSRITMGALPDIVTRSGSKPLSLLTDSVLAGLIACLISVIYNSPWRIVGISAVCGMVGHGLRYLCMGEGFGLPFATLIGCLAIGLIAEVIAARIRVPFATLAFAAAITMMPGLLVNESLVAAVKLAAPPGTVADPALAAGMLSLLLESSFVLGAIAIGLLGGARLAHLAEYREHSV